MELFAVGTGGTVLYSEDGKKFVRLVTGTEQNFYGCHFIKVDQILDHPTVFVYDKTAGIFVSTDKARDVLTRVNATNFGGYSGVIHFVDRAVGYLAVHCKGLYKTEDGGRSWSLIFTPPDGFAYTAADIYAEASVYFLNPLVGFVAFGGLSPAYTLKIYKTEDGGNTWDEVYALNTSGYPVFAHRFFFSGPTFGTVGVSTTNFSAASPNFFLRTKDGGDTWEEIVIGMQTFKVIAITSKRLVATGTNLRYTLNGGITWTTRSTANSLEATYIYPGFVAAYTVDGRIHITVDGGDTWGGYSSFGLIGTTFAALRGEYFGFESTTVTKYWDGTTLKRTTQAETADPHDLFVYLPRKRKVIGWVVGQDGLILKTETSGIRWQQQDSGVTADLYDVYFVNENVGYAVGANGTILKTTDGGSTWTKLVSPTSQHLRAVHFVNPNLGWIVGESGIVLKTVNGGVSWTSQASGVPFTLRAVYFVNSNVGWAVGDGGTILCTANGGSTWTLQSSGTLHDLHSVYFVDENEGWAVGDGGVFLHTTDGGDTWVAEDIGTAKQLAYVKFFTPLLGVAVGGGYIT